LEFTRTYRANAIVLRRINIGEADRVLTLYTREKGKLSAIAKGARKHLSKFSGATELLTYGRFFMATGRDLDVLTQVEIKESFPGIRRDLACIAHATHVIELTNALVEEHEPHYDLFDTLLSALYMIEGGIDPEIVARYYELQSMSILGYRPEINSCTRCGTVKDSEELPFSPSLGGRVCDSCGPLPDDVVCLSCESVLVISKLLEAEPETLRKLVLSPEVKGEIAHFMKWHIRYRLDRELKSADLMQTLLSP
jgi:DNA repair protein RecO (recombination protein O)